jgi:Fe2+ transport system protein FeoA
MMITISKENYLKAIAEAEAEGNTVISALSELNPAALGNGDQAVSSQPLEGGGYCRWCHGKPLGVSPAFEERLVKVLGHKATCPHGNGLTVMSPEQRRKRGQRLLSEAEAGSRYRVCSVYERDRRLLEFLQDNGIRPGTHLKVESRNYDGTSILKVESKRMALGSPVAEKVWVAQERQRNLH